MNAGRLVLVLGAGAAGAVARHLICEAAQAARGGIAGAVLAINAGGSFALGVLTNVEPQLPPAVLAVVGTGFLGAFTTFSTFTATALTERSRARTLARVAIMVGGCALAAATGRALAGVAWPPH